MTNEDAFEKITSWKPGMPWEVALEELRARREAGKRGGGKVRTDRHHSQGKLTVRERIDALADPDSFFEMGSLIGRAQYDDNGDIIDYWPSAYVTGLAEIDGRQVTVGGNDFTIQGGSPLGMPSKGANFFLNPMSLQYGIPCVHLHDGAGANAGMYESQQRMHLAPGISQWWPDVQRLHEIPVVSAIMGSCAGAVAGYSMLCHFSIMVKGTGQLFPAGPPVVARALGQVIDKDDLGGTKIHAHISGAVDNEAEDEEDCFRQIREFLSYMPDNVHELPARRVTGDDPNRREEELLRIIPTNHRKPYDMYQLIGLLVDDGRFFEMRKHYGAALITCFARMDGYVVGILASNPKVNAGAIDHKGAQKMSRFIDLCNLFNIPVVLIPDVPGFMIGLEAEKAGTMRYGMAAVMAAQEATVPKVHIAVRKGYGMGGDAFSSVGGGDCLNLRFGWPSGEWGSIPIEGGVAAAYRRDIESSRDPEARRRELEDRLVTFMSPFRCAEAGDVMEIIDPRETRSIICRFLRAAQPFLERNAATPKRSVRPC